MKFPPYMVDSRGYCYATTPALFAASHLKPWCGEVDANGYAIPGSEPLGPWAGLTAACIASGPSLVRDDVELVRGLKVLTANDSWRVAPWADTFCAADRAWWQTHIHELPEGPQRWTGNYAIAVDFDLEFYPHHKSGFSTGAMAINIAAFLGATRVILLGYDCSLENGVHWHGLHEKTTNPDDKVIARWVDQFKIVADAMKAKGVEVINCSRKSALTCFPRASLGETLASIRSTQYNTANAVSGDRDE